MGDDNHSTALGRFLGQLPLGEKLKTAISAGDYVLDKAVGLVDKDGTPVEVEQLLGGDAGLAKSLILEKVLAGPEAALSQHDFEGLTPEENAELDDITLRLLRFLARVGARKAFNR